LVAGLKLVLDRFAFRTSTVRSGPAWPLVQKDFEDAAKGGVFGRVNNFVHIGRTHWCTHVPWDPPVSRNSSRVRASNMPEGVHG